MYYSVVCYPQLASKLSESIDAIRRDYDPSWRLIEPHVDICFPATNRLDEKLLANHVEHVLSDWSPFVIQLGGLHKSRDHWLFLTLREGADEIKRLHREMYTGYLAKYKKEPGKPGYDPMPHLGLGLFLQQGCTYDWRNPRESDFDHERYEEAMRRAEALPLPADVLVERLHITAIPDVVIEWTSGKRVDFPGDAEMIAVREFRLGQKGE
ncbi:MAG: 2'-5' RNA ligase family protein [candidate division Zixibacteria bacterium]|nr:2'-5' RNA ligase family protein [candidate division Zixibacteria bacterium]